VLPCHVRAATQDRGSEMTHAYARRAMCEWRVARMVVGHSVQREGAPIHLLWAGGVSQISPPEARCDTEGGYTKENAVTAHSMVRESAARDAAGRRGGRDEKCMSEIGVSSIPQPYSPHAR
jgi:hypothetical protein